MKSGDKYICTLCNFNTKYKYNYEKHQLTQKHLKEKEKNIPDNLIEKWKIISLDKHELEAKNKELVKENKILNSLYDAYHNTTNKYYIIEKNNNELEKKNRELERINKQLELERLDAEIAIRNLRENVLRLHNIVNDVNKTIYDPL